MSPAISEAACRAPAYSRTGNRIDSFSTISGCNCGGVAIVDQYRSVTGHHIVRLQGTDRQVVYDGRATVGPDRGNDSTSAGQHAAQISANG
jgi:hypothetical protein